MMTLLEKVNTTSLLKYLAHQENYRLPLLTMEMEHTTLNMFPQNMDPMMYWFCSTENPSKVHLSRLKFWPLPQQVLALLKALVLNRLSPMLTRISLSQAVINMESKFLEEASISM